MNPDRDQEEKVFDTAREIASAEARATYLAAARGSDTELRRRVEEILEADAAAGEIFETRVASAGIVRLSADDSISATGQPGDRPLR